MIHAGLYFKKIEVIKGGVLQIKFYTIVESDSYYNPFNF